jgi:hypothetical protein
MLNVFIIKLEFVLVHHTLSLECFPHHLVTSAWNSHVKGIQKIIILAYLTVLTIICSIIVIIS